MKTWQIKMTNRCFRLTCMIGLTFVVALNITPTAEGAGFNINPEVTFTPISGTFATTSSTIGCPTGFAGRFTFTALLTNKTGSPAMPGVTIRVRTLTNGNLLLDSQTNAVVGGAGAEMAVPKTGQYADGLLSPGASVNVPFAVCLKTFQPFQFLVDVFGVMTQLVSANRSGTGSGNGSSGSPVISANGRFVAFNSFASDLVANDANNTPDAFARDLQMGTTILLSANQFGMAGNDDSTARSISADGRFVALESFASDLVTNNDANGVSDVFVRDIQTGTTTLVSVNRFGTSTGNGYSNLPLISTDGRFVAFDSNASDLVAKDTNGAPNVFVRDMQTGVTTLVSVNRFGTASGNGASSRAAISANGRYIVFVSDANDLVSNNDFNANVDVFVRDTQLGTTTLVSVNRFGTASGNADSGFARISADGRFVAFHSNSNDLVPNDTNASEDVFVRDMQLGTTALVSINRFGSGPGNGVSSQPLISADARYVAFDSSASDLVANDTNSTSDVFIRDLQMGTTTLVSINRLGTAPGNSYSFLEDISADAHYVAFISNANDLVPENNVNGTDDVFVRDLQTGKTTLMSVNILGTASGNSASMFAAINADGRFVAFQSTANDLVTNDTSTQTDRTGTDVFVRPVTP